tara:strand:- start:612 stop:800 length:189 start_codon:yes stop_codon:yes gene_type:complete
MGNEALSPALKFEYRFLKQQVDRLQNELGRRDRPKNTEQDLFRAREELKMFVSKLRKEGVNI